MKILSLALPLTIAASFFGVSSTDPGSFRVTGDGFDCSFLHATASTPQKSSDAITLESVLKKMDAVAATFRTAQAEFEWQNYQKVIDEVVDVKMGAIYYRRSGKDVDMMANVKKVGASPTELKPEPQYVLFSDGKVKMYTPKTDQVTVYDLGKNRADLESYVVLGFGGSGQDLLKTFDVALAGTEDINGVTTAKLELIPKAEKVRRNYNRMVLWIDPNTGIAVRQQFFSPQGDYRLSTYSSIRLNEKISDDVFRLKTTSKTQTISPTG
jgi:outer membrane lipoprotein-sorting protein